MIHFICNFNYYHHLHYISICSSLLCVLIETSSLNSPADDPAAGDKDEDVDDAEGLQANKPDAEKKRQLVPRWPTRVFAIDCLMKIIAATCDDNKTHFDLVEAKARNKKDKCEYCY